MSRLALSSLAVNYSALVENPRPTASPAVLLAAVIVVVLIAWAMRLVRQTFAPVMEMLRVLISAGLAVLMLTGALILMLFALIMR